MSCRIQVTSQSDLLADVDAGSSALLFFFFFFLLLLPSGPEADY